MGIKTAVSAPARDRDRHVVISRNHADRETDF